MAAPCRLVIAMSIRPAAHLAVLALIVGSSATQAADPEYIRSPKTTALNLPFSDAVRSGGLLFLSGQIGNLPGTVTLADGGIEGEARQAMKNIGAILDASGSSWQRVVKCTIFLADIKDWPAFNTVYREFFTTTLPARSALAASGLAMGAKVEVECIAAG